MTSGDDGWLMTCHPRFKIVIPRNAVADTSGMSSSQQWIEKFARMSYWSRLSACECCLPFTNMDMTATNNAMVRLVTPIHKKTRGPFWFNLARMQKKATKQTPVINKARGHENCGSRSGSFKDFGFTGLNKTMLRRDKIISCGDQVVGNITCV